jgi:uncharacterized protein
MTAGPREIVEQLLRAGREQDVDTVVGLMAPDGYIEWPYRPPAAFHQTVIAVFRVQDGQVQSYRDYINPLPLMEALASITSATRADG